MTDFNAMTDVQLDAWAKENKVDVSKCPDRYHKMLICAEHEDYTTDKDIEVQGVKLTVNIGRLNEYDTFDALHRLQKGEGVVLPDLVDAIFGDDWPRIKKALTGKDGLSASRVAAFVNDVYTAAGSKN